MCVEVLERHVLPEAEDVDRGFVEQLAEHGDEEIGVGVHHLFDQGRIVVEQLAEPLDARQVAQRAEKAAPAVRQDHQHVIAVAMAAGSVRRQSAPSRAAKSGCIRSRQNLRKSSAVSTG